METVAGWRVHQLGVGRDQGLDRGFITPFEGIVKDLTDIGQIVLHVTLSFFAGSCDVNSHTSSQKRARNAEN
jgi:hypothetical protein